MAKIRPTPWIGLAIVIIAIASLWYMNRPYLKDIAVINLDTSTKRWETLQPELKALPYPIRRFSAVDGRKMTEEEFDAAGIPYLLWPAQADEKLKKKRAGEIGCYLSHKTLIEQFGSSWALPNAGHLVLEDDVTIAGDAATRLNAALRALPMDWDILCLGIGHATLDPEVSGLSRVRKFWGTYAYMVRHGSIPKILQRIHTMNNPIDDMLSDSKELVIYAMQPPIVNFRLNSYSDIQQKVT
jgi:GR25 family glycosyltransferase involved in LPS biosynthesis